MPVTRTREDVETVALDTYAMERWLERRGDELWPPRAAVWDVNTQGPWPSPQKLTVMVVILLVMPDTCHEASETDLRPAHGHYVFSNGRACGGEQHRLRLARIVNFQARSDLPAAGFLKRLAMCNRSGGRTVPFLAAPAKLSLLSLAPSSSKLASARSWNQPRR